MTNETRSSSEPNIQRLFDLSGRVALVTGASRGLGLEIARGLGEAGASVVISGRRQPDLAAAEASLISQGISCHSVQGSVTNPIHAEDLLGETIERFGNIDILVNNAGRSWGAPTLEMPLDRWEEVFETNVTGSFLITQTVIRQMLRQAAGGRIINIASLAGLRGSRPSEMQAIGYSASKAALIGMTRVLATHFAHQGINVNAIAPGFFRTRMSKALLEKAEETIVQGVPLGRLGSAGELKGVAVFLASDASAYITGQIIIVDGGASAW